MEVVSVEKVGTTSFHEYVYDLETEEGTYVAGDGILLKNTDSCYVKFNVSKDDFKDENGEFDELAYMKEQFRLSKECADRITKTFKKPIDLEFEKVMYPFFLYEKKRYAYQEWEEVEHPHDNLEFKGLSVVRRDYCTYTKEVCIQLFNILMRGTVDELYSTSEVCPSCLKPLFVHSWYTEEKPEIVRSTNQGDVMWAVSYAQKAIKDLFDGKVPIEKLIISNSLAATYKVDGKEIPWTDPRVNRTQVKLAQKIREIDPVNHPKPPERVPYLYVERKNVRLQWERVAHPDYMKGEKIDTLYYFDHQLKEPILQIFELLVEDTSKIYEQLRIEKINDMNGQKAITKFFKQTKKKNDKVVLKKD